MHVGKNFIAEWPERTYTATLFKLMNDHKLLGEKTKQGFYTFETDRYTGFQAPSQLGLPEDCSALDSSNAAMSYASTSAGSASPTPRSSR